MNEVWVVVVETGEYSDFNYHIDGAYATEAEAVMRIVNRYHGQLSDRYSRGHLEWEIPFGWAQRTWGDCVPWDDEAGWPEDGGEFVDRSEDAPDWWGGYETLMTCRIERLAVRDDWNADG